MLIENIKIDLNGRELILRNPTEDDAELLIDYFATLTVKFIALRGISLPSAPSIYAVILYL